MTPRFQKFALLAHINFSVGWFGAILPYLALVIAGLTNNDPKTLQSVSFSMELIGWYVIVPFSFAALLSGLAMSLGTQWGLFRHWWIVAKFALTIFAVFVLLRHMEEVSRMAKATMLSNADFRQDLIHASGGLLVLFAAMTLSVFKPWGKTPYGRNRTERVQSPSPSSVVATLEPKPVSMHGKLKLKRIVAIHAAHAAALVLLIAAVIHISGMHHH